MDDQRSQGALGGIVLAFLLMPGLIPDVDRPPPALDRPADPVTAAELGWRLSPQEPDAAVWSTLPGIGPARAETLAEAARRGAIACPHELLRLPGFGIKMAAVVRTRVDWTASNPSSAACSPRLKGP